MDGGEDDDGQPGRDVYVRTCRRAPVKKAEARADVHRTYAERSDSLIQSS
jgi:hypothetical protein